MDAREPTANNAELWAYYLRKEWALALDPLGIFRSESGYLVGRQLSDAVAATVAAWTSALLGPIITALYTSNEAVLAEADAANGEREPVEDIRVPEQYAAAPPAPAAAPSTQVEDWRSSSPIETNVAR